MCVDLYTWKTVEETRDECGIRERERERSTRRGIIFHFHFINQRNLDTKRTHRISKSAKFLYVRKTKNLFSIQFKLIPNNQPLFKYKHKSRRIAHTKCVHIPTYSIYLPAPRWYLPIYMKHLGPAQIYTLNKTQYKIFVLVVCVAWNSYCSFFIDIVYLIKLFCSRECFQHSLNATCVSIFYCVYFFPVENTKTTPCAGELPSSSRKINPSL